MKDLIGFEKEYWDSGELILGVDEAGYGCLAGSMFIAGVMFPSGFQVPEELKGVRDSKKTDKGERSSLSDSIKAHALHYFVLQVSVDEINMGSPYHLRFSTPSNYISSISLPVNTRVIMDGDRSIEKISFGSESLVKGDSKSFSIASASILAKHAKDLEMEELDKEFPNYKFITNQGYGTPEHIKAIRTFGICKAHRISYVKSFGKE